MTINEYQKLAMTTQNPALSERDVLLNGVMGLCGESGEAQGALSGGLQHRKIASPQGTRSVIGRLSHEHRKPF